METWMADRKQFAAVAPADEELLRVLEESKKNVPTDLDLREQRISFAYGNAMELECVTKESVRTSSLHLRLLS